jgi:tripartite-type tricarboxylate transporter receptor subunit TctC
MQNHFSRPPLLRRAALGLILAAALPVQSLAQSYPSKLVTLVVPFPAGGGPDLTARILAEKLSVRWGQAVVVDNKPGAGGLIGANGVAKSAADGHQLLLTPNTLVISPHVLPKGAGGGIDVMKDLVPVIAPASTPMVLVAHPDLGVKSVPELITLAKRSPGMAYASAGNGSPMHFAGEMFKKSSGVDLLHVPYRGTAPALTAVLSGEVKLLYVGLGGVLQQVKAGKLTALAVTEKARTDILPIVPTATEQGVRNVVVNAWYGVFAPAATPAAVVTKINQDINEVLKMPDVRSKLIAAGIEVLGGPAQTLADFMKEDDQRYGSIAREMNIKAD